MRTRGKELNRIEKRGLQKRKEKEDKIERRDLTHIGAVMVVVA